MNISKQNMWLIWVGGFIGVGDGIIKILTLGIVRTSWQYTWVKYSVKWYKNK